MCINCACNNKVGPSEGSSGDDSDAIAGGQKTISAGIAKIEGSSLSTAVYDKMEAAELLPYVQARPAWTAFCDACLNLNNLSFAFIKTPQLAQAFWATVNGSNGSTNAVSGAELQEAEQIHSSLEGWLQQTTAACWQSLGTMQNSQSLSTQQQAHLLLKLVDAETFKLEQANSLDTSGYASGVHAALALVPSLANLSAPEKYQRMTTNQGIELWQGALAVAVSMCSPASTSSA